MAINVGKVLDNLIEIDLESWSGFQDTKAGRQNFRLYCDAIIAAGVRIRVCTDFRASNFNLFNKDIPGFLDWLFGVAESIWTQTYWTEFGLPMDTSVNTVLNLATTYGIPYSKLGVMIPGPGANDYAECYSLIAAKKVMGLGLWEVGDATASSYVEFAKISNSVTTPGDPPVNPPPVVPNKYDIGYKVQDSRGGKINLIPEFVKLLNADKTLGAPRFITRGAGNDLSLYLASTFEHPKGPIYHWRASLRDLIGTYL
jgi:hypothetical protein